MANPFYSYISAAERLLKKQAIQTITFARNTYQVEIFDQKERFFPLLQIKDQGQLLDAFCTCATSEQGKGCEHLAAAYEKICPDGIPFHLRFQKSLWNQLGKTSFQKVGADPSVIQKRPKGVYQISLASNHSFFSLILNTTSLRHRCESIFKKQSEAEFFSSFAFSTLTTEEVAQYKEGRAPFTLNYELSFWSEFAKWLAWLAESEPYEIIFLDPPEDSSALPCAISIQFAKFYVQWALSEVDLTKIIPCLKAVKSPLSVWGGPEESIAAHYDPIRKTLQIHRTPCHPHPLEEEGILIDTWRYIPHKGFVYESISEKPVYEELESRAIGDFLSSYAPSLQNNIHVPIHLEPVEAHYMLSITSEALTIHLYLFQENDLEQPQAAFFLPWGYLPESGFWKIEKLLFEEQKKIILKPQISDFIDQHRHWLRQFPGFQPHFNTLESHLTYGWDVEGGLTFTAELDFHVENAFDFDHWIYLQGQGFYAKTQQKGRPFLYPGLTVPKSEIPVFLTQYHEELEQVRNFFAATPAIEKISLSIQVNAEGMICIRPDIQTRKNLASPPQIYADFTYVPGEGFSLIPSPSRLPEAYRKEVIIPLHRESSFLKFELETLKPYASFIDPKLEPPQQLYLALHQILKKKRRGWSIQGTYVSSIGSTDLKTLWSALQNKKTFFLSPSGLLFLKEVRFQWLRQLPASRFSKKDGSLRLTTLEWIRLSIFENIIPQTSSVKRTIHELELYESKDLLNLHFLQSSLRPYQETGVQWLWFLYCHQLSGLLCDDMGLGKTHQAMALLAAAHHLDQNKRNRYLIVCPTSVIYHWQELLARFLPTLKVHTHHGLGRAAPESYDLFLTSYGILRLGSKEQPLTLFDVAIFDEIQVAKNHKSQTYQQLRKVKARMKLGLSGTPIENRLRELKTLFDLVLPGYLPPETLFRDTFLRPIEKEGSSERKALLTKLIRPFLLRRKKSEVLADLPEKIEEIAYCDLSEMQRALYFQEAQKMRSQLLPQLQDPSQAVPYVHIFAAFSALKQICDHPALFLGEETPQHATSGKWHLFIELLEEARNSGQKVVVFSQYVKMLEIIENNLSKRGIGYAAIRGSTRDRHQQILRFREDPACEVFVASLLAAGVGIDLTVASIVIHYDRWWNPAKENQATDRVHRIGQNRGVQVFKLVTKHTIEEHIHSLIEKKQKLFEDLIISDDTEQIRSLSREELISICQAAWEET